MVSPAASTVVIECPHCGTRYQLPEGTVSAQGRKVACAHCGETWTARPLALPAPTAAEAEDVLFDEEAEADLDAAFAEAEAIATAADPQRADRERTLAEIRGAVTPPIDGQAVSPAADKGFRKLQRDFRRRQAVLNRRLPFAKLRRGVRLAAVAALLLLIATGIVFRAEIVRQVPDLAGMYEALGLGVNVVGLEFREVTTLVTVRGDSRVFTPPCAPQSCPKGNLVASRSLLPV